MFGFGKKPDPLELIDEIEEIFDSDDPQNPRINELYSQVLRQGWYMEQNEHGEWVWFREEGKN